MDSISRLCAIDQTRLDDNHLTQSIINEAVRAGLLSEKQAGDIHLRLICALGECVEWYTAGDSSSVLAEKAQSLFASMIYCLDVYLAALPDACAGVDALENEALYTLYRKGSSQAEQLTQAGRKLYEQTILSRISTGLIAYNDTLDRAIPEFFQTYDVRFGAHETMASIDYPLAVSDTGKTGIKYMLWYLQQLILENAYCLRFAAGDIERLIRRQGELCHTDGHELLVNIFELVLLVSYASVLVSQPARALSVSPQACAGLRAKLLSDSRQAFGKAREELFRALEINEPALQACVSRGLDKCEAQLLTAAREDCLAMLLMIPKEEETAKIHFSDGEKMQAREFRALEKELRACSDAGHKAALIHESISSFEDLLDILAGGCLYAGEYARLFDCFDEIMLAMLLKSVQANPFEMRIAEDEPLHLTENEREWRSEFSGYLKSLEKERLDGLFRLASRIGE